MEKTTFLNQQPLRTAYLCRNNRGISMLEMTLVLPIILGLIFVLINMGIRSYNRSKVIYALSTVGKRAKADSRFNFDKWKSTPTDPQFDEYKEARRELADTFQKLLPSGVQSLPINHYDTLNGGNTEQINSVNLAMLEPGQKISLNLSGQEITLFHPTVCLKKHLEVGNLDNSQGIPISSSSISTQCTENKAVDPSDSSLLDLLRTEPLLFCAVIKTFTVFGDKLETLCSSTFLSDASVGGVQPTHTPTPNDCMNTGCGCDSDGRPIQSASTCLGCLQNSPYGSTVIRFNKQGNVDWNPTADEFAQWFNVGGDGKDDCYVKDWTIIWHRYGGCFDPTSKIKLADGSLKNAIDVHQNDLLLNAKTGEAMRVTKVVVGPEAEPMLQVGYSDSAILTVSQQHPILTKRGPIQARNVTLDDELLGEDNAYHRVKVLRSLPVKSGQKVYNFEVETLDGRRIDEPYVVADGIVTGEYSLQQKLADRVKESAIKN